MQENRFKSGFIAIVGRPNVGKSTLLNTIVGQKIAIMSDKPQTTRNRIMGILTNQQMQGIFLDTPGIHKPHSKLGNYMVKIAENTLGEVDLVVFITDVSEGYGGGDEYIIEMLKRVRTKVILVLNKTDLAPPEKVLAAIDFYKDLYPFAEIIPASALKGQNIDRFLQIIGEYLPEGPMYYPGDQVTDHPERFIAAELIREKVLHLTREEIPHSVAVVVEQMESREEKSMVYIHALIYTERDSQKAILIGKQGELLKKIGQLARRDIERLLGSKVYLELWIKVKKDWRNQERLLRNFGFTEHQD
ncbi:GTPase Era [Fodinisporobacter ferrooxydans]|uniref:GTPase Era n=1 Tax=Fodinisporobacter ferrooxydans TaxID=2901836 RepID=A0ABY4CRF4_9BACL|nr:GTPase Era [Alicyclobacillaceae bacterium MYW30-H2]